MKIAFLILFLALPAFAEDFYVAEVLQGNGGGSSAANATNKAFFNTVGNWGSGAGKISAGDTVYFVGTHSTNATVNGSGSAGSPITLKFDTNAKFSAPRWTTSGPSAVNGAAIQCGDYDYIVVDGQNTGLIEATDTGVGMTYNDYNIGVYWSGFAEGCTVQNLRITNMFVKTYGALAYEPGGCVQFRAGVANCVVSNVIMSDANVPIYVAYNSASSNFTVTRCWSTKQGEGAVVIAPLTGGVITNITISYNEFIEHAAWGGEPNIHMNTIHLHSTSSGSAMLGVRIFGNYFHGDMSDHPTSYCFLEGYVFGSIIYNNLFRLYDADDAGGNGMLFIKGCTNTYVFNNTFWSESPRYTAMALGGDFLAGADNARIFATNNLVYNVAYGISTPYETNDVAGSDYNIFYAASGGYPNFLFGSYSARVFDNGSTGWRNVTPFDDNSTTSEPTLDANLVPTSADTVAKAAGVNLTAWGINTDYNGNPRPSSGPWTIGAFQYQSEAPGVTNAATVSIGFGKKGQQ